MQVTVESTGELERRLTITLPEEDVKEKVQSRLRSMAPRVKMDGFRPGKVPFKVVERRYGPAVRQEILEEFIEHSFRDAIKQESLRPAGPPRIEPHGLEAGQSFKYTATFEVFPDIKVINLKGIVVKQPVAEVTEAEVEHVLEKLRNQSLEWEPVDRPAREGDGVTITYQGTIEGESFPGGKGEDFLVPLGKGVTLPAFEEQLYGVQGGQERTFELTFPEDYANSAVAGKKADFGVQVKSVAVPKLPAVDEAFAEKLGIKSGGVEALREEIRATLVRNLAQAVRERVKKQVMEGLLAMNPMVLPHALVESEAEVLLKQAQADLEKRGIQAPEITLDKSPFREQIQEQARQRVALSLILGTILEQQQIEVDSEKLKQQVAVLASSYEDAEEFSRWIYSDRERLSGIEGVVLEDQVIDWVLTQVEVVEEPMSFEDLVNSAPPAEAEAEDQQSSVA
jgi:trigger factor